MVLHRTHDGIRHMAAHDISRQYWTIATHDDFTCMALSTLLVMCRVTIARRGFACIRTITQHPIHTPMALHRTYGGIRHMAAHDGTRQNWTIATHDDFTCMALSRLLIMCHVTIARRGFACIRWPQRRASHVQIHHRI